MNRSFNRISASLAFLLTLGICATSSSGQAVQSVISLEPLSAAELANPAIAANGHPLPPTPANFRRFGDTRVGEVTNLQKLTLHFSESTRLTAIHSTPDFHVEQGSSCVEGNAYPKDSSCTVLMRFTPQGAGQRLGRLTVSHSASSTPFSVGLGGSGYVPVVSFTPALITTVPGTNIAGKGLLTSALNLTVDGGDSLYVADTGNNLIRYLDSSGVFNTISSGGLTAPTGIAVDSFGEVFFTEPSLNKIMEIFSYGPQLSFNGSGTDACNYLTPCKLTAEGVTSPGQMSMDPYNQLFFTDSYFGAALSQVQPYPPTLVRLYDPFAYQETYPDAFAVDASDNLYTFWNLGATCALIEQTLSNAETNTGTFLKVAGGRTCGFSGDGGQARNAEIGTVVSQIAFDAAGNLYFTDQSNQRVRRIDASTGIINTIAGTGTAGYSGDGGPATAATLSTPTGVSVDSQGQVYIISNVPAVGTAQAIRRVGPNGILSFGIQLKGSASAAKKVTISNTGNALLTINNAAIVGINASDFTIDPNNTSCALTPGSTLNNGQSCTVGIIFNPAAGGTRSATLNLTDNTVNNANTVMLSGVGALPNPTMTITSPASGASFTAATPINFSVTVTSTTTLAPTGTVKFSVDGVVKGSPVTLSTAGVASISLSGLTVAGHSLAATYNGDANYAAVGPLTRTITVTAAKKVLSAATLTPSANPAGTCKQVAFTVSVTSKAGIPGGSVQLKEGSKILAQGSLVGGKALLSVPQLGSGKHILTATYAGDASHLPATSAAIQQSVVGSSVCQKATAGPVKLPGQPGV